MHSIPQPWDISEAKVFDFKKYETFVYRFLQDMAGKFNDETGLPKNAVISEVTRERKNGKIVYDLCLISLKDIKGNKHRENYTVLIIEEDVDDFSLKLIINNNEYELDTLEEKSFVEEFEDLTKKNKGFIKNVVDNVYSKSALWRFR